MKHTIQAFSLPELITVVAIMGIIATIAVSAVYYFTGTAKRAADKLMAQNFASTYSMALANGHDFAEGETGADVVVSKVVTGTTIGEDFVGLPDVSVEGQTSALAYLEFRLGRLLYKPE